MSRLQSTVALWRVWYVDSWCFPFGLFAKLLGARAIWVAHVPICGADGTREAKIDFQIGIVPADGT
jgi:hypothetical protein